MFRELVKASSMKYFRGNLSQGPGYAARPNEIFSACFHFLHFVFLNVRIHEMLVIKSSKRDLSHLFGGGFSQSQIYKKVRTHSGLSKARSASVICLDHLLCSFQHTRLHRIVVIRVNGNWKISAMLFRLELSYTIDTTAAAN